jgi:hypothetical protein
MLVVQLDQVINLSEPLFGPSLEFGYPMPSELALPKHPPEQSPSSRAKIAE